MVERRNKIEGREGWEKFFVDHVVQWTIMVIAAAVAAGMLLQRL